MPDGLVERATVLEWKCLDERGPRETALIPRRSGVSEMLKPAHQVPATMPRIKLQRSYILFLLMLYVVLTNDLHLLYFFVYVFIYLLCCAATTRLADLDNRMSVHLFLIKWTASVQGRNRNMFLARNLDGAGNFTTKHGVLRVFRASLPSFIALRRSHGVL